MCNWEMDCAAKKVCTALPFGESLLIFFPFGFLFFPKRVRPSHHHIPVLFLFKICMHCISEMLHNEKISVGGGEISLSCIILSSPVLFSRNVNILGGPKGAHTLLLAFFALFCIFAAHFEVPCCIFFPPAGLWLMGFELAVSFTLTSLLISFFPGSPGH